MKAIRTRYLCATDYKGSRVVADDSDGNRIVVGYRSELNNEENRDSGLLDKSNAAQIAAALQPFIDRGTVCEEHHGHFLCGWVDGYSILVRNSCGHITRAFRVWCALQARLADYPILDEEHYSRMEYDAAVEAIAGNEPAGLLGENRLPDDWATAVYSWLAENEPRQLESHDDQGAYPSEDSLVLAIATLYPGTAFPAGTLAILDTDGLTLPTHDSNNFVPYVYRDADENTLCAECAQAELDDYLVSPGRFCGALPVERIWHLIGPALVCDLCGQHTESAMR